MRKSRFSEEQIISILKEAEAGLSPTALCRRHGISDATFYNWRKKSGGLEVSEAKRLRALEDENAKLKKLLAEQMMDVATLKELLAKSATPTLCKRGATSAARGRGDVALTARDVSR